MLKSCLAAAVAAFLTCAPLAHAANPVTSTMFTADPAALVDNGRVYLYVATTKRRPAARIT